MTTKDGTILSMLINALCRVGALLFVFFFPTARLTISRFQSGIVSVPPARRFVLRIFIRRLCGGFISLVYGGLIRRG